MWNSDRNPAGAHWTDVNMDTIIDHLVDWRAPDNGAHAHFCYTVKPQ